MTMTAPKRNRKYYQTASGEDPATTSKYRMFLVRYHDDESNVVQHEGPYPKEEDAIKVLNSYLRQGICSWLVSYNE